jgi:hypothetical protein
LWCPTVHADHIRLPMGRPKRDPLSVRGNEGIHDLQGRISELQTFCSVNAAAPERVIRVGCVSDPVAVARERRIDSRDARKKRQKLLRFHIVADEFASPFCANREDLFPVPARDSARVVQRPIRKADGLLRTAPEPGILRKRPKIPDISIFIPASKY